MKLDPTASWGYPVLRSSIDDYVEGEIQSSINLTTTEDFDEIVLSFKIDLSVNEIRDLIIRGLAKVVIYVYCRETWFGQIIDASSFEGEQILDKKLIEGLTEFWTFVIATSSYKEYRSKNFHPDYGDASFDLEENQILAIADPMSQFISRDILKNVSSLFDYAVNLSLADGEWRLGLNNNRLTIEASSNQIKYFRQGENSDLGKSVLLNGIFLPAVAQAITSLTDSPELFDEYQWARVIKAKLDEINHPNLDSLGLAQQLLRLPTKWLNKNMKWIDYED